MLLINQEYDNLAALQEQTCNIASFFFHNLCINVLDSQLHGSYEAPLGIEEKTKALIATKPATIYRCPTKNPGRAKNDKGDNFNWYLEDTAEKENLTDVHALTFDGWGLT